jgi:hypothetical protein
MDFDRGHRAASGMLESICESLEIGDDKAIAFALDETVGREATQHERDRFASRTHELAEQPPRQDRRRCGRAVALDAALRQSKECGDEALLDGKGRVLTEPLEQLGALGHDLARQCERSGGLLPHESTYPRCREMQCLALFLGARIADVATILNEPLTPERFADGGDPRHKASARTEAIPQYDLSAENNEDSIGRGSTLIHREPTRPGRSRTEGGKRVSVLARKSRDPRYGYGCHVTTCRPLRWR